MSGLSIEIQGESSLAYNFYVFRYRRRAIKIACGSHGTVFGTNRNAGHTANRSWPGFDFFKV